jgi:hypothetical protein
LIAHNFVLYFPPIGSRGWDMTNETLVTTACVVAGSACFFLYVFEAIVTIRAKPAHAKAEVGKQTALFAAKMSAVSIGDVTKLFDSGSKLADSLAKAGPAVTSLIGAILFFAIAAVSSGALRAAPASTASPPAAATPKAADAARTPVAPDQGAATH